MASLEAKSENRKAKKAKAKAQGAEDTTEAPAKKRGQFWTGKAIVEEFNARYCVVQDGSRVRVLHFELHDQGGHSRLIPTFLHFAEFKNKYCNRIVKTTDGDLIAAGAFWLTHPNRRQYDGLTFQPNGPNVIKGKLNLWQGWKIKPAPGDWTLMRAHIFEVLCAGDEESFQYLICWLAWCVQHPDRRAEVAAVFKGRRGTGKGTLGNAMCKIFGQHGIHISNADHLTGRFNNHMRDACFLFADEAYFPGTLSAEGDLKRKISEPTLFIESKGRDGVEVPNMLHVMLASNEAWIVPAGEGERRFVQFDVSDIHMQNNEWFGPLFKQLDEGGLAAMLHDLLNHPLDDWHPRQLPANTNLLQQQKMSLRPLDAWFVELLESGVLVGCDPEQPNRARSGKYLKLIDGDEEFAKTITANGLFDDARIIEPRLRAHTNSNAFGDYLRDWGCTNDKRVCRERGWTFPKLSELRAKWQLIYPNWQWRNPDLTDWQPEEFDDEDDDEAGDKATPDQRVKSKNRMLKDGESYPVRRTPRGR